MTTSKPNGADHQAREHHREEDPKHSVGSALSSDHDVCSGGGVFFVDQTQTTSGHKNAADGRIHTRNAHELALAPSTERFAP